MLKAKYQLVQLVSNRKLILYWGFGGLTVMTKILQLWKTSFTGTEKSPVKSTGSLTKGTVPSADDPHSTLLSGQVSLDFICHPAQKWTPESAPIKIKVGVKNTQKKCFLASILTLMMIFFHTTVEQYSALRAWVTFSSLLSLGSGTQFTLKYTLPTSYSSWARRWRCSSSGGQEALMEAITYEEPWSQVSSTSECQWQLRAGKF